MPDRNARVWTGSEWENISAPIGVPNAIAAFQAAAPSSPVTGQLWVDQDDNRIYVWNGSSWAGATEDLSAYATKANPTFTGAGGANGGTVVINSTLVFTDGTTNEGRMTSAGDTFYIQAGTGSGDTTAKLNIARNTTTSTNISQFNIYADTTSIFGNTVISRSDASTSLTIRNSSSTTARYPQLQIVNYSNTGSGFPALEFYSSRGSQASPTASQSGDQLGGITGWAWDGTSFNDIARIYFIAENNFTNLDSRGIITFQTKTGTTISERMRINSSGNIGINTTNPGGRLSVQVDTNKDIVSGITTTPAITYRNGSGAWFHAGKHTSSDYFEISHGNTPSTNPILVANSSSNVGIGGVLSPSEKFHILGLNNTNPAIVIEHQNLASYKIGIDGSVLKIAAMDNGFGGAGGSFVNNDTQVISMTQTGRVGIGTISPDSTLTVIGTSKIRTGAKAGSNTYLRLESSDASNTMELLFSNNTNTSWTVQSIENGVAFRDILLNPSGGNVGIGTNTITHRLNVSGVVASTGIDEWMSRIISTSTTSTGRNHFLAQRANGTSALTSGFTLGGLGIGGYDGASYSNGWNGGAEITAYASEAWTSTARGTHLAFLVSNTGSNSVSERMRISSNGNVGIGTSSPGSRLSVAGDIRIDITAGLLNGFTLWNGAGGFFGGLGTESWALGSGTSSNIAVKADAGRSIIFYTNGTSERMRIDSAGRIQIPAGGIVEAPVSTNAQTGTAYTLVLADAGRVIEMNNAAANTLTVPTDASVNFPIGTVIDIFQTGAGQTTVGGAGVTINARPGLKLSGQWATATLIKRASNTWLLTGSLSA